MKGGEVTVGGEGAGMSGVEAVGVGCRCGAVLGVGVGAECGSGSGLGVGVGDDVRRYCFEWVLCLGDEGAECEQAR